MGIQETETAQKTETTQQQKRNAFEIEDTPYCSKLKDRERRISQVLRKILITTPGEASIIAKKIIEFEQAVSFDHGDPKELYYALLEED